MPVTGKGEKLAEGNMPHDLETFDAWFQGVWFIANIFSI